MSTAWSYADPWNPPSPKQTYTGTINPYTGVPYENKTSPPSTTSASQTFGVDPAAVYGNANSYNDQLMAWAQDPVTAAQLGLPSALPTPLSLADLTGNNVGFPTMDYGFNSNPYAPTAQVAGGNGSGAGGGNAQISSGISRPPLPSYPTMGAMPNVSGISGYSQSAANPYAQQMAGQQTMNNLGSYFQQAGALNNNYQQANSSAGLSWAQLMTYLNQLQNKSAQDQSNSWMNFLGGLGTI